MYYYLCLEILVFSFLLIFSTIFHSWYSRDNNTLPGVPYTIYIVLCIQCDNKHFTKCGINEDGLLVVFSQIYFWESMTKLILNLTSKILSDLIHTGWFCTHKQYLEYILYISVITFPINSCYIFKSTLRRPIVGWTFSLFTTINLILCVWLYPTAKYDFQLYNNIDSYYIYTI